MKEIPHMIPNIHIAIEMMFIQIRKSQLNIRTEESTCCGMTISFFFFSSLFSFCPYLGKKEVGKWYNYITKEGGGNMEQLVLYVLARFLLWCWLRGKLFWYFRRTLATLSNIWEQPSIYMCLMPSHRGAQMQWKTTGDYKRVMAKTRKFPY